MPEFKFKSMVVFTVVAKDSDEAYDILSEKDWFVTDEKEGVVEIDLGWVEDLDY